jgi:hypothetical protein
LMEDDSETGIAFIYLSDLHYSDGRFFILNFCCLYSNIFAKTSIVCYFCVCCSLLIVRGLAIKFPA